MALAVYTKSIPVLSQKVVDILTDASVQLGIADVYYGMQNLIPRYPAVVVEGGTKVRRVETTRQYGLTLSARVYIFHGKIDQESSLNIKETEELAEAVEDLLNTNRTMDGLVIHGFVTRIDPGTAIQSGVKIKSSRLIWEGRSREVF